MLSANTLPAAASLRARCRQIAEGDLDALTDLLARGFVRSNRDYWLRGFARFRALPPIEGVPRFGYVLESEVGIVGVILLIPSRRGDTIFSNLSSWYVEPAWRAHEYQFSPKNTSPFFNIPPMQNPHGAGAPCGSGGSRQVRRRLRRSPWNIDCEIVDRFLGERARAARD